jgi:hypothetical protein
MAPKPKEPTRAINRTDKKLSDFMKPKATAKSIPKASKPTAKATGKVKITGKASTSGGRAANTPSITNRGSIAQSPKVSKSPMSKKVTGEAAAKQYQKEISPKGMASAKAAQSKALDKKYPGLYKNGKK